MTNKAEPRELKYAQEGEEFVMGCPFCGFDYNHADGVGTQKGNDNYETEFGNVFRGDAIVIKMHCENGHKYRVVFGEHKGTMYVFAVRGHK